MDTLLKKAVEAIGRLPSADQDEIARLMLDLARNKADVEDIDPADLPSVMKGLDQARRREFASENEVTAAFRRFGS